MKIITVNGVTQSGKTTVCETIIHGLRDKGFSVGSVKEIHFEQFAIDTDPNANTNRHRKAGSQLVTARGMHETDILYQEMLPITEILKHYNHDYVILEGVTDLNVPRIITAHTEKEVEERIDGRAVLVSGRIANEELDTVCKLPVINALTQSEKLIQFVIENAIEPFPNFDKKCCGKCGYDCKEFAERVIQKREDANNCVLKNQSVHLTVNGNEIPMVPFVQQILKNSVLAVAKELDGFNEQAKIEVKF